MNGAIIRLPRCMSWDSKSLIVLLVLCLCVISFYTNTHNTRCLSNFGFDHSNEGTQDYGDQSGMMGSSYSEDEGPLSKLLISQY